MLRGQNFCCGAKYLDLVVKGVFFTDSIPWDVHHHEAYHHERENMFIIFSNHLTSKSKVLGIIGKFLQGYGATRPPSCTCDIEKSPTKPCKSLSCKW